MMLGLFAITWSRQWWSWDDLTGTAIGPVEATLIGVAAYFAASFLWRRLQGRFRSVVDKLLKALRLRPDSEAATASQAPRSREYAREMSGYWPRSLLGRLFVGLRLTLSPIVEELATRGVLVVMVYKSTDSIVVGLALGASACVLLHLHTGVEGTIYHLLFFTATAALAIKAGLASAIALHVLTDIAHATTYHIKHIRAMRTWERSMRKPRLD
ncbi:MAG: CPBP family intramembrane metalloprotease [Myxococcaceae bacterium]|nr:CPBP family intramembrane metalloprotease [Myxococcaceae bacterium]